MWASVAVSMWEDGIFFRCMNEIATQNLNKIKVRHAKRWALWAGMWEKEKQKTIVKMLIKKIQKKTKKNKKKTDFYLLARSFLQINLSLLYVKYIVQT